MGNLGRIKKQLCASNMDVKTKRRLFRGKNAKKNRKMVRSSKLLAMPTHEEKKKEIEVVKSADMIAEEKENADKANDQKLSTE